MKSVIYLIIAISLLSFPFALNQTINVSAFIDYVIFIDPGHGGKDNGASYLNIYEDEINLNVAEKLYERCLESNFMAFITRTADYDLSSLYSENHKQEDLKKRAEIISHSGCDIFVSIHMNHYSSNDVKGPMVYYKKNDDNSYLLSKCVQRELNVLTNMNKNVHSDNFYLFRKCDVAGVLIECGFISNEEERNRLLLDSYQDALADAIYHGIYNFYLEK